jgi:radical SAM superfamily enzyme
MTLEEYIRVLKAVTKEIPETMVVHRLTGDGPKKLLVAPLWTADKKRVLNTIRRELDLRQ